MTTQFDHTIIIQGIRLTSQEATMNTLKNDAVARCFLYNYSDLLLNLTAKRQLEEYCSWQEQAWFRTPFGGKKCKIYSKDCFKISKQFPGNFFVPAGFYPYLAKKCEEANIEFINSSTLVPPSGIFTTINGLTYREQQEEAIKRAVAAGRGVIQAPTASGKCLGKNTPVLMYDGTIKKVQNIEVGDLLMGPDSKPRKVLSTTTGQEEMFRITPKDKSCKPYTVNKSHILSLVMSGNDKIAGYAPGVPFNIAVSDYLNQHKTFKHCAKAWRAPAIQWGKQEELPIDPYFFGLWLGDGSNMHPNIIFTPEIEIKQFLVGFAESYSMKCVCVEENGCEKISIVNHRRGENNAIKDILGGLGVQRDKHIPHVFKTASEHDRWLLLAGILDTDGYHRHGGYDFISKYKKFANDVVFLARSLGLYASVSSSYKKAQTMAETKEYFRVCIGGDAWKIPCKVARRKIEQYKKNKDKRRYGFSIESIGEGDYYGFEISGPDRLFLLGDFTVTHNTIISMGIFFSFFARYKNIKGLFLAHTVDLVNQAKEEFEQFLPGKVGIIQGSNISPNKITCGTIQSVSKLTIQQLQKISDMVIVDEVHKISGFGVKYFSILQDSLSPIRFGVTATPPTTKEGLLAMEGAIGPIIGKYTISDGVKAGYLSVPKIHIMNYPNSHSAGKKTVYKDIYRQCVVNNPDRNTAVCKIVRYVLKRKETVLLFVKELAHGNNLAKMLDSLEISYSWIHGKSEKEERALVKKALEFKEAKVVICSTIWNEGISIKSLNNVINAAGGKDSKRTIQIVGRGTRVDEGKTTVTIWDFADKQKYLSDHADDRISTYKSQGWEVEYYE